MNQPKEWTYQEEQAIIELSQHKTISEIAKILNINYHVVYNYCRRRSIKSIRPYRKWSDEDTHLLEILPPKTVSEQARRDRSSVYNRKKYLVKKGKMSNNWKEIKKRTLPVSDEQVENFFDKQCSSCKHENINSCCSILSIAYENVLPKQWDLDKSLCSKHE